MIYYMMQLLLLPLDFDAAGVKSKNDCEKVNK